MSRYFARWIFPGDGPPLQDATIEVVDGIVQRVESGKTDATDLGNVAILPGLINAHTHLEFSVIETPLEPLGEFALWIQSVIDWRRETGNSTPKSIERGIEESVQSGVTSIAEIATTEWRPNSTYAAQQSVSHILMFREYLGLSDDAVESQLTSAREFLERRNESPFSPALSPHAPYSLHPELFDGLCSLAEEYRIPLAIHLAESPAELELLEHGRGPLATMLQKVGVFRPELFKVTRRPLDYLQRLDCDVPVLLIHGNYFCDEEIDFLSSRPQMSVVYCPRTHAAMQRNIHPWQRMLAAGINVTLGTDSRASNPDLSIWNELRFLHKHHPELTATNLLKLSTINAAKALGLESAGSLAPGNVADLCVVPLSQQASEQPEQHLFASTNSPQGTMVAGNWIIVPDAIKLS